MKRYITVAAAAVLVLIGAILLFAAVTGREDMAYSGTEEITSVLNDIAKTAEDHRTDLSVLDGDGYGVDAVILGMANEVLWSNTRHDIPKGISVEMAVKHRMPYVYLTDDGGIWGTLIVLDDGMAAQKALRTRMIAVLCICAGSIIIVMTVFGTYIYREIVVPFRKMQGFAGRIAEGRLDEPLMRDRNGMFGVFSESFDIMREELAASRKRELSLQKKERELVASLSHDLKTPVTGIKLASELMQMRLSVKAGPAADTADGDKIVLDRSDISSMMADAQGIHEKADQIDALVTDLFTSVLDDLGEFKVSCTDEDTSVLCDMIRRYDDRWLTVIGEVPAVIVSIDKKRMAQVIGNIISNSYKYAGTAIDVTFRISGSFLEMCIADQGPGVPADEIDLITNKFYRGKAWADSSTEGNGLGLYIAKTLMVKMGGDLAAASDNGLSVTLIIPLS